MKKVLFTATVDSHINSFHLPYLKLFKDKGYEVHVATNTKKLIEYCDVKHKLSFERNPFKVNNLKAIKELKKILNREKFDLIHTHTPVGSVVTRIAAKETRKENKTKVIYTAHGFHFYKGASVLNWLIFYPIEKILSKYTDTLITINQEDYKLAKNKFKKTNVEYVPGVGVKKEKFDFQNSEEEIEKLKNSLGCSNNSFIMIFPAELSKRKNQIMLIKVMKKINLVDKNIHLLLPGKDLMKKKYNKIVDKYDLNDNIHFLGYRQDIPKLLEISDIAVSSSKQEGLPVNIIEAMMSKLPIIITNCRGNVDLINENGYLVDINDIDNFLDKILFLKKDLVKLNLMSKRSLEISKKYLLSEVIDKVKLIYDI